MGVSRVRKFPEHCLCSVALTKCRRVSHVQCKQAATAAAKSAGKNCVPGLGLGIGARKKGIAHGGSAVHIEIIVIEVRISQAVIACTNAGAEECAGGIGDHFLTVARTKPMQKPIVCPHINNRCPGALS